jgi:hypothetical protein
MKPMLRRIRNAPFFPIVPFVPMAILGGLIALEAFTFARLRKLARRIETLHALERPATS